MDVVRAALGEDSLSYLGFSYGTTLGSVYGTLFPERLDRAVLDSAMPPEGTHREQYTQMAPAHTANVDRFTAWLAEHDDVYGLGEDAEEVHGLLLEVSDRLAADPREDVPGWGPLDGHGLYGAAGYACATEAVDAYLVDGRTPEDVSCAGPAIPEPIPPLP